MKVVIVESPAKAKTINKYLGKDYDVYASFGHVRDLAAKDGSVDPDDDFAMRWEVDAKAAKRMSDIGGAVKTADRVILATDPDREGEAISWHIHEISREEAAQGQAGRSRCVQRGDQGRGPGGDAQSARDRRGPRRRLPGAPRPRLSCRLQPVAGSVAKAAGRALGRSRAIGRLAHRLRPRARDRKVRRPRILVDHRPSAHGSEGALHGAPGRRRRQEDQPARYRLRRRSRSVQGGAGAGALLSRHDRIEAGQAPSLSALHHFDAAAGGVAEARSRAGAHHADCAAPL